MTTVRPAVQGVGAIPRRSQVVSDRDGRHGRRPAPRPSCLGCGRGCTAVPRVAGDPQPAPVGPRGHPGPDDAGQLPVRRLRPRCGHRRDGGHDRARAGVGDRAVPVLRPTAVGARPRRDRRRPRQGHHAGTVRRPRGRHGDPHGQRRPRSSGPADQRGVGRDARRPGPRRVRSRARCACPTSSRSPTGSTCAWPSPRRGTRWWATPAPTAGRRCGLGCPICSSRRRPRSPSSATTSRSASARRSAPTPVATASTTRCGSAGSSRPNGC